MPKLRTIAKDPDAGRVRSCMLMMADEFARKVRSELDFYGNLFNNAEQRRMQDAADAADKLADWLNKNEDRRLKLARSKGNDE